MTNEFIFVGSLAGGGLAGALVSLCFNSLREWRQKRKRHRSYWSAMSVEVDLCAERARTYTDENAPQAPLYRLSTIAYDKAFPVLLADGVTSRDETRSILRFYGQVEQINRGLEYVQAALTGPNASEEWLKGEIGRVRLKANNLLDPACTDPGGPYYSAVRAVIDRRVR